MDRIAEWRPVEPAGPDGSVDSGEEDARAEDDTAPNHPGVGWRLIGAAIVGLTVAGFALAGLITVAVLSSSTTPAVAIDSHASLVIDPGGKTPAAGSTTGPAEVVVDVEGAVDNAGLLRLPRRQPCRRCHRRGGRLLGAGRHRRSNCDAQPRADPE